MINQKSPTLPTPDSASIEHNRAFCLSLDEKIQRQGGSISFSEFMKTALYDPKFGYYSAGAYKIGKQGDFITAPEISPLFAYCLANQCAHILEQLDHADILEFGAGSGQMALDLLTRLKQLNILPEHYYILEVSADLKQRQQTLFEQEAPDLLEKVIWLDSLPNDFTGIMLGNEVLDAMPVSLFEYEDSTLSEYFVSSQAPGEFNFETKPASKLLNKYFAELLEHVDINTWPSLYVSEINTLMPAWIESIASSLKQGVVFLIDYGFPAHEFYHPERSQGTLMCHYQHHAHPDPLKLIGLQDITAHVDFTALTSHAINAGLELEGYTNQGSFLVNCGITQLTKESLGEAASLAQNNAIKKLTFPTEMGELFKVIGFSKDYKDRLMGFDQHDYSNRL